MDLISIGIGVVVVVVIASVMWRMLRPKELPPHLQGAECASCGWKGTVSRYAGRCPRCNSQLGEGRAQRKPGA